MDDKVKLTLEALEKELGEQCMSAAADAIINENRPRVAAECQKYADERREYADAVKAMVEENERLRKVMLDVSYDLSRWANAWDDVSGGWSSSFEADAQLLRKTANGEEESE